MLTDLVYDSPPAEGPSGLKRRLETADIFGRLAPSTASAWSVILESGNERHPGNRTTGAAAC